MKTPTLANCVPSFRGYIETLAARCGQSAETVFGWWTEYTRDCSAYDQSPVMSEFERWYADRLAAS